MSREPRGSHRLPRALHPGAWWLWALGMATAASRTTNPVLLAMIVAVVAYVVAARRTDAPWARGFKAYLLLGLVIIGIRVGFRAVFGGQYGEHVLVTLPELPLPDLSAGVSIGGPVTLEGLLGALYDGLRLATLLICVGAANLLANPKRLLKALPSALHEVGVTVTIALTMAPQLVESAQRVHRARKLRGEVGRRTRILREVGIPVMTDALDRSLLLAAAMDSRGYGRVGALAKSTRALTGLLVIGGLVGVCIGTYGLLDSSTPRVIGLPLLGVGLVMATGGVLIGGRRVHRTRYRPDPWRAPEWAVAASGIAVAVVFFVAANVDPSNLNPSLQPLQWPAVPLVPTLGILLGALPAWLAPPVASSAMPVRPPIAADRVGEDPSRAPMALGGASR